MTTGPIGRVARPVWAIACALALPALATPAAAQSDSGRVQVVVRGENRPLAEAQVQAGHVHARTDHAGRAVLQLPAGAWAVVVAHLGFRPDTLHVTVHPGLDTTLTVDLQEQAQELASVVVTATRVAHRVEDEPTRVETLAGEEIAEKTQTQPGSLTQLLQELSGVRTQVASPVFGATGIRIQGLPGQYTQVLMDGLPLLGAQFGVLSLAEVPPVDLSRVEVIKGAATALYGPAALAGVVNLVSRPPGNERELIVNQTSQSGTDALAWVSSRLGERWGLTLLGGVHHQTEQDVDGDGWADVPGYQRVEFRPRVYWNSGNGASIFATVGGMSEHRIGGTLPGDVLPHGVPYATAVDTNRADGGVVAVFPIRRADTLTVRSSATQQWDRQDYGPEAWYSTQHGSHHMLFSEATLTIPQRRATWLIGAGYEQDGFTSSDLSGFDYRYTIPSVFLQTTVSFGPRFAVTASGRCDWHSEYGTFCSPRVSGLWRASRAWSMRLSGASGFFAPTPFIDETEGIPLARIVPFSSPSIITCTVSLCANDSGAVVTNTPFAIQAERVRYGSLDISRRAGPLEVTATLFASQVDHPLILWDLNIFDERPQLKNATGPIETAGGELFAVYAHEPLTVLVEYSYVHSTAISPYGTGRTETPVTPRHSGGLDVAWESDETNTRVAVEVFYTGEQTVLGDPYRTTTPPYATLGLLVSQRLGRAQLYVSGANLTDVRQTHYDPLLTLTPGYELRWTTSQWAPLAGRVVNAGIRVGF